MNAIILAGGHSSRMNACGISTHKPLLPILGLPNIERTIIMLNDCEIREIVIVAGLYAKNYEYLYEKYNCKIVSDPSASVSTLYAIYNVMDFISDTFIIEGDVVLAENIFVDKPYSFYYTMKYPCCEPDAWMPIIDAQGRITSFEIGQFVEPCIFGISFWSKKDAPKIIRYLKSICTLDNLNNGSKFWDDYFVNILTSISIYTYEISAELASEINTKEEYINAIKLCEQYYSNPTEYFLNISYRDYISFYVDEEKAILYTRALWNDYNTKHPSDLMNLNIPVEFKNNEYHFIIRLKNNDVGFIDIVYDDSYLLLRRIFIDKPYRRQAIGTYIVTKIISFSRLIGKELRVNVYDDTAGRFYERIGFQINYINYHI